jgi:hypothetical protein
LGKYYSTAADTHTDAIADTKSNAKLDIVA